AGLVELAKSLNAGRVEVLLAALDGAGESNPATAEALARLLPFQWPEELAPVRARLANLARSAPSTSIRQSACAALALADGRFDAVWKEANTPGALIDLLGGIPLLQDPEFRGQAMSRVLPLLNSLPPEFQKEVEGKPAARGQFVRIALPRRGTLT